MPTSTLVEQSEGCESPWSLSGYRQLLVRVAESVGDEFWEKDDGWARACVSFYIKFPSLAQGAEATEVEANFIPSLSDDQSESRVGAVF